MEEAKKITITGKVHDVGYRLFPLTEAGLVLMAWNMAFWVVRWRKHRDLMTGW